MEQLDNQAFEVLFREAFQKCFGHLPGGPMSETEAKIFASKVLDQTGLTIGWKSVKNYSIFILDEAPARQENPSITTLDTLARYVLGAPYTTEIQRKKDEGHHPYWFMYRDKFVSVLTKTKRTKDRMPKPIVIASILIIAAAVIYRLFFSPKPPVEFTDDFHHLDSASLSQNGWYLRSPEKTWWDKRTQSGNELTLFTLEGDTWPNPASKPVIKNLLLRENAYDCFTAEVHLDDFVPSAEWQQAGLLIMEDTLLTGRSIRFTLAYNDYFGGNKMPSEIYVQAIKSLGNGFGKPEEVVHHSLFTMNSLHSNPILIKNLQNSALRVEKTGNKIRFLYSGGVTENEAFREIGEQEFDIKPRYIGIFAIKGFTNSPVVPVKFKFFKIAGNTCP